ncbi:MAG: SCO family protein, partial [Gammaproteobacteria bacterium]
MIRALLTLPLMLLTASLEAADSPALKAGVFVPARLAPDFALVGSDGRELRLSRYRGKVVLLGFGFTSCSEVCPITLAVLAQARRKLGAHGDALQIVYITVDPERDHAERLRRYLAGFDPTFVGGTGSVEQLDAVRRNYGVVATKQSFAGGYSLAHSSSVHLIDRKGMLRG